MKGRFYIPLFSLLCIFIAFSCEKSASTTGGIITPPVVPSNAKTWLALGDSYTIGQSVSETDRFPVQTKNWLADNGITMANPEIVARTGWTTDDLSTAISSRTFATYNVVSLLIGVNDQFQRHDTTGYRQRFTSLLLTAIGFADNQRNRVFVVSIPDYGATPAGRTMDTALIRMQIDQFNAINKEVTLQNSCNYTNITPGSREALNDPSLVAMDGLHPSGKEYRKWALMLGPMMLAALR